MSEQNDAVKNEAGTCGSGCNCGNPGIGKRSKWLISGVVMLAACGVAAVKILGAKEDASQAQGFALPAAVTTSVSPSTWGAPLTGMADLNVVATNSDAVFVVIPSDDAARMDTIQKEVDAATSTISEKGTQVGKFLLSKDAEDYKGVVAQIGAPAVLAMVKGRGMAAVTDKDVTKDALLKAFVGASRPASSCGPVSGGCGPRSCN